MNGSCRTESSSFRKDYAQQAIYGFKNIVEKHDNVCMHVICTFNPRKDVHDSPQLENYGKLRIVRETGTFMKNLEQFEK